jgi:TolA-binding protein
MAAARKAGVSRLERTLSASDLLELADLARFAGSIQEAESALSAVRRRFPGSKAAAAAAFRLGKIAFDRERAYARAATHFETYLEEHPSGPLAPEAWHRVLESYHRSKRPGRARTAARAYLDRYPNGSHAALARRLLEP